MIDQQEATVLLQQELPDLQQELNAEETGNIYQQMRKLLLYTAGKIKEHNYAAAGKCFHVVNALHEKGNTVVKNTVENVFVFSFSSLLHLAHKDKRKLVGIIPASLYALYLSQACHTGY